MICAQLPAYEPSTLLVPVCLYINLSARVNLDVVTSTCPGLCVPGMALSCSAEPSPYQSIYLHPGNYLAVKAILHVSAPVENVPVYSTK